MAPFWHSLIFSIVYLILGSIANAQDEPPRKWHSLFNGVNLNGWHGRHHFDPSKFAAMSPLAKAAMRKVDLANLNEHWRVENGEIVNDGQGAFLTTDIDYGDIELELEYKIIARGDSGVYLRGTPQVQIWDSTEAGGYWKLGSDKGSGGLWNNSTGAIGKDPLELADRPLGEWNKLRILQIGARTSVWLNEKNVVDHAVMENFWNRKIPLFPRGPIQLQTHGNEVRWRNIALREISSDEAGENLSSRYKNEFESIFNGKNLDGWSGAVEEFEVHDESMVAKTGHTGILFTNNTYTDFVVRLFFKLTSGGNSGLAIRYPGIGVPSSDGMCEVQILDSEHPMYADLDDRQHHGSVYGLVPAARGYLRPVGEWNFQEVTVNGTSIIVELNGTVILDADLSEVTNSMNNKEHPGKNLTLGHFGIAGHNDPIEFRRIMIKRLE